VSTVQICALLRGGGWTSVWVDEQRVPYMYRDDQWVAYDNVNSVTYKARPANTIFTASGDCLLTMYC